MAKHRRTRGRLRGVRPGGKEVITLDIATALIILLCGWLWAHLFDAAYWYNRNLVIIANIERQFLESADLKRIHYYFGKHRPDNRMITHLKIQFAMGIGLASLVLLFHFFNRVLPGFGLSWKDFDPVRLLPYLVAAAAVLYCRHIRRNRDASYREFLENSPGIDVAAQDIAYGVGHGFGDKA